MTATAPPFAYYGGKTKQASRIAALLPAHEHYVEPFAGSLAVLLAKPPSAMETVNDLDADLMIFWRVLREQPEQFADVAALTPHSRAEHQAAYDLDGAGSDLERARRVWVLLTQGRGTPLRRTGWRFYRDPAGSGLSMPGYLSGYVRRIPPAAARLAGVSLECRPALEMIREYGQHRGVLIYADPPYLGSTRSPGYAQEMLSEESHRELAEAVHDCRAAVVLSGYPSDLYEDLYGDWHRSEYAAWTGNGIRNGRTRTDGERTEVLWSNRPLGTADLFDG
ncbi:MAG TPA: DNA adenine methylase, partial [Gemmatimonadales bacterium]|nr:DNA adenine methylase [Gemmatimonadales bacterium]